MLADRFFHRGKLYQSAMIIGLIFFIISGFLIGTSRTAKADTETRDVTVPLKSAKEALQYVQSNQLKKAEERFEKDKEWWFANKQKVKNSSLDLAQQIDKQIADVSLAFVNDDQKQAKDNLTALTTSLENYKIGAFTDNQGQTKMNLSIYITKLKAAKTLMQNKNWTAAQAAVQDLQQQWLAVEGDVVSQSQKVYTDSERNLVVLDAYIKDPAKQDRAADQINQMIAELEPLADAHYSWMDAALIPLREGLEALLVVGALLTFAKKAGANKSRNWIIGGTVAGLLTSVIVGSIVVIWLSAAAFGQNNTLINGWAGVIASAMMLYVSYWLHSNSDIAKWNQYIANKSKQAITNGRMVSFAFIAYLAIVREGMETVIFLIGMAGRMSAGQMTVGIVAGFGVLALIAFLMIKVGVRLPLKPFFIISSAIVFYLCFKFMGSGIHSLQLAGVIPSTVNDHLPSINAFSIFPSWYSTLPQAIFLVAAIFVVFYKQFRGKHI
ncbi:FTR1 family iron permease [Heyndrickxia ginsengihumi]|nr:FTR1 family protein [Heyndrickxia ginsengihumi]MCM3022102.1 FTR1 family iron permease [Heyndrickxia ginsengihumi]